MAAYMAQRIIDGAYDYAFVIARRPDLQDGIDAYMIEHDRQDLIQGSA